MWTLPVRTALLALCAVVGIARAQLQAENLFGALFEQRPASLLQHSGRQQSLLPVSYLAEAGETPPSRQSGAELFDPPLSATVVTEDALEPTPIDEVAQGYTAPPSSDLADCNPALGCEPALGFNQVECFSMPRFRTYAECQLLFARAHVLEGGLGAGPNPLKLSESYDLSPRTVVGVERYDGNGVRARYWHYGEQLADIANAGAAVGFDFDVFDIEGYHRFRLRSTDIIVSGGFRAAEIGMAFDGDWHRVTGLGLTAAADGESLICFRDGRYWSAVYGARLSVLGGDWSASGPGIPARRDDNLTVSEVYFGLENGCRIASSDLYWRMGVELQNWHSDNLASGTNTDSISFVGPTLDFGVSF